MSHSSSTCPNICVTQLLIPPCQHKANKELPPVYLRATAKSRAEARSLKFLARSQLITKVLRNMRQDIGGTSSRQSPEDPLWFH
ncbi:hypothetical protein NQZ68_002362 [Dissostichus eleginoides]|nr:hypothetical protein NQZ68_002362 [Dissostichus eleginoides]